MHIATVYVIIYRSSRQKVLLKISPNSQETTCVRVCFLIKLQHLPWLLLKILSDCHSIILIVLEQDLETTDLSIALCKELKSFFSMF